VLATALPVAVGQKIRSLLVQQQQVLLLPLLWLMIISPNIGMPIMLPLPPQGRGCR
jgi:hypothetical protein